MTTFDHVDLVVEAWNAMSVECQAHRCRHLNENRRRKLTARLKDDFWHANWREALAMVPARPFLNGENDRGWTANFDWFIRPGTVTKLIEGQYPDGKRRTSSDAATEEALRTAYPDS